jgi:hypothetical protein
MTDFFNEYDEVVIIDGQYDGSFRVVSPKNITQCADSNEAVWVTIIEPLDVDAFKDYLLAFSDIDINYHQEPIQVSIEPHRLQRAESLH